MKNYRLLHILKSGVTAVMVALFLLLANNGFAEKGWQKVTSVSSLSAGDSDIIVAADYDYALSTTQQSNNRTGTAITKSDNIAVITSDVQILTLEAGVSAGTFAFYSHGTTTQNTGYLYAAGTGNYNYLRTKATLDARGSFLITIDANGATTIVAQTTETERPESSSARRRSSPITASPSSGFTPGISLPKKPRTGRREALLRRSGAGAV